MTCSTNSESVGFRGNRTTAWTPCDIVVLTVSHSDSQAVVFSVHSASRWQRCADAATHTSFYSEFIFVPGHSEGSRDSVFAITKSSRSVFFRSQFAAATCASCPLGM